MSTVFILLAILCLTIMILPAKYDPAIRLRDWLNRRNK
jgi:hypothetical protein